MWGVALLGPVAGSSEPTVQIIQPYENANLPAVSRSFVFGSVSPATASLTLNGAAIKPHTNGGFLAMIPFQPGFFKIEAIVSDGVSIATMTRTINVAEGPKTFPLDHSDIEPLSPRTRVVVQPGELLELSFQGAPQGTGQFKILGGGGPYPMQERPGTISGVYSGAYRFQSDDDFEDSDVQFFLKRKDGKKISAKAGAKITVQKRRIPRVIELKEDAILLTGPGGDYGYNLLLVQGTKLEVTGEWGDFLKVAVGRFTQGWIRKSIATELSAGTPVARSISNNVRVSTGASSTIIEIPLQHRHPHRVEQITRPHRLKLLVYGVIADTDRIRYRNTGSAVREITWHQLEPDTCVLDIITTQNHAWGYDVRYEGTTLILEIRHRPVVLDPVQSLQGLRVAVDAGHSRQNFGTIGPLGNTEASVNLMAAKTLKQELERRGAWVVMIQDGMKEISLQERTDAAWKQKAHLFISLHADACAEGQDPRELEGYSVHYYHPQSHDLAESIHRIYGQRSRFRDQGLWRSNLAVCRMTQMPSLLLEQGFLILPEFEEVMMTPQHHQMVANVVVAGIIEFIRERNWEPQEEKTLYPRSGTSSSRRPSSRSSSKNGVSRNGR